MRMGQEGTEGASSEVDMIALGWRHWVFGIGKGLGMDSGERSEVKRYGLEALAIG